MYQGDVKGKQQAKVKTLASDPFFMQDVKQDPVVDYLPKTTEIDFSNINIFKQ